MADCTSFENKVSLLLNDITSYQNLLNKKINELNLLVNPPKENPEPKFWMSVEEVAKEHFNQTEEYLFNKMESLSWIRRSGNYGDWLINQTIINSNWLKHDSTTLRYGRPYGQIKISEFGIEKLRKLKENG